MLDRLRGFLENRRAHRLGRRDGKKGIPLRTERVPPFALQAIKERGDGALWAIAQDWAEQDSVLKGNYLSSRRRLEEAAAAVRVAEEESARHQLERAQEAAVDREELERLERLRRAKGERAAVSTVDGGLSESLPSAAGSRSKNGVDTEGTKGDPLPLEEEMSRPAPSIGDEKDTSGQIVGGAITSAKRRTGIGPIAYWSIIVLIVLGEIPLNAIAFRLFGEIDALTYLMTFSVALILIACAHALGIFLSRESPSGVERLLALIISVVPTLAILGIAVVRNESVKSSSSLTSLQGTVAFGLINLLIFAGAIVLSYLKHDPLSEHNLMRIARRSAREKNRQRKRTEKLAKEREKELQARRDAQRREEQLKREELERLREKEKREQEEYDVRLKNQGEQERRDAERAEDERWRRLEEPLRLRENQRARELQLETKRLEGKATGLSEAKDAATESRAIREKSWEAGRARVMDRKNHYERLMLTYCAANVAAREDRLTPEVLSSLPEVEIPPVFTSPLAWVEPEDGLTTTSLLRGSTQ
jgi:hypothetical protein